MAKSNGVRDRLRSEAAAWVARLDDDPSEADREEFVRWLKLDPAHQQAYDKALASYGQSVLVRQSPLSREVSLESEFPAPGGRLVRAALAAGIAGLLLVGGYQLARENWFAPPLQAVMLTSGSAPRDLILEDGTAVRLGPSSAIRIDLMKAERRAELQRGQARLSIAADDRPFVLEAGNRRSEVREGRYLLSLDKGLGAIEAVDEKSVALPSRGSPIDETSVEPKSATMLDFEGSTLAEVAVRANRLNAPAILDIDPSLAGRKVTGLFKSGDSMALGRSLAAALDLELVTVSPRTVRLEPRKK